MLLFYDVLCFLLEKCSLFGFLNLLSFVCIKMNMFFCVSFLVDEAACLT